MTVGNKCDAPDAPERLEVVREFYGERFPMLSVSAKTGENLEEFRRWLFEALEVIRIYTRRPGQKEKLTDPFTLPIGSTVLDAARLVHKEIASKLKFARIWGVGGLRGRRCT